MPWENDLHEEMESLTRRWTAHADRLRYFSCPTPVLLDHDAVHRMIAIGHPALPWIIHRYQVDDRLPWGFVVEKIADQKFVDDPDHYHPLYLKCKCIAWWNRQSNRSRVNGST